LLAYFAWRCPAFLIVDNAARHINLFWIWCGKQVEAETISFDIRIATDRIYLGSEEPLPKLEI
jgi:hypothetical protein